MMASINTELEQGWSSIMTGFNKLKRILEGEPEPAFNATELMNLYSTVYRICNLEQKPRYKYSKELYDKYLQIIKDYNEQTVLPSIKKKHGEQMLRELVKRWSNNKIMLKRLSHIFAYLDRYYIPRNRLPSIEECGLTCFRDRVYHEIQSKAKDVILALIHKEREGEQIDSELLRNVIDVFIENGRVNMERYEEDFESFMLQETASYYSRKASKWIQEDSCPDYMLKSEECLKKEKERVTHYLHLSTESKLIKIVQNKLLVVNAQRLLENEHSGCRALLRDCKIDDLSRMYKLYHPIPKVLETILELFKQQFTEEVKALTNQTTDTATDQLHILLLSVDMFNRRLLELQDKYMNYVNKCFQKHDLFHKVLIGHALGLEF